MHPRRCLRERFSVAALQREVERELDDDSHEHEHAYPGAAEPSACVDAASALSTVKTHDQEDRVCRHARRVSFGSVSVREYVSDSDSVAVNRHFPASTQYWLEEDADGDICVRST